MSNAKRREKNTPGDWNRIRCRWCGAGLFKNFLHVHGRPFCSEECANQFSETHLKDCCE
jgi:hypothetical protein